MPRCNFVCRPGQRQICISVIDIASAGKRAPIILRNRILLVVLNILAINRALP